MSMKLYYFTELSEHDVMFSLAQKAKHAMQHNDFVNEIYQKYEQVFYGQSSGHIFYLMKLNTQSIVSNCLRNFCSNSIQDRVSTSPEIKNQSTSTPVTKNRNISTIRRTNLQFDNEGNETSQSVTSSPEKQPTPMKLVPSTKESDSLLQEHLTLISADEELSEIVSRNGRKQLNPVKKTQNAPELENSLHKCSEMQKDCKKDINPTQVCNFFKSSGKNKKSPSTRTDKVLFSFLPRFLQTTGVVGTANVSYLLVDNLSPTTSPVSLAEYKSMNTERDNIDLDGSPKDINFYAKESETGSLRDTCPSGKSSLSSNTFKKHGKFEIHRKLTTIQEDTVLSNSAPIIIQASGALEIDTDTSYLSEENFIPTTSFVSSVDYKINEDRTDNIDKNNSPKENRFSEHTESKAESSRDISLLEKTSLVDFPLGETNKNSPIRDDIRLGNDIYQLLKESPPTNLFSEAATYPGIIDLDVNALAYCIKELTTLVSTREQSMQLFYDSLLDFRKNLEYLITYIMNILQIVHSISMVNKDHVTEEDEKVFIAIMQLSANLLKKYDLWHSDLKVHIQFWDECLQQIHEIKSRYEPFLSNDQPLVTIVILQAYEEELKIKWKQLDDTIPFLDDRISLFLATAEYLENSMNLLIKCLITVGILKPLIPML